MERIELKRILTSPKNMKLRSENCVTFEFVDKEYQAMPSKSLICQRRIDQKWKDVKHRSSWEIDETNRVSFVIHVHDC